MKKTLYVQSDMFECPKTENDHFWESIQELKDNHNSVRKRVFGDLKEIKDLLNETRANYEKIIWHLGLKEEPEEISSEG